jgi:hypothetical protein
VNEHRSSKSISSLIGLTTRAVVRVSGSLFDVRAKLETPSGSLHNSRGSITSLIKTEPDVTIIGQYLGTVRLPNYAVDNFTVQFSN